jgi:hypothetical protein
MGGAPTSHPPRHTSGRASPPIVHSSVEVVPKPPPPVELLRRLHLGAGVQILATPTGGPAVLRMCVTRAHRLVMCLPPPHPSLMRLRGEAAETGSKAKQLELFDCRVAQAVQAGPPRTRWGFSGERRRINACRVVDEKQAALVRCIHERLSTPSCELLERQARVASTGWRACACRKRLLAFGQLPCPMGNLY